MDLKNSCTHKLQIVGIGPGHQDYQLPIAKKLIEEAYLVIGSQRCLRQIQHPNVREYGCHQPRLWTEVEGLYRDKQVLVVVAGDPGFYSLLDMCCLKFGRDNLEVYPGISSFQYLFARLKMNYKEVALMSLHGRESHWIEALNKKGNSNETSRVFLLTDDQHDPNWICKTLLENGLDRCRIIIGENLSYEDECISEQYSSSWQHRSYQTLCVVVIIHEMVN